MDLLGSSTPSEAEAPSILTRASSLIGEFSEHATTDQRISALSVALDKLPSVCSGTVAVNVEAVCRCITALAREVDCKVCAGAHVRSPLRAASTILAVVDQHVPQPGSAAAFCSARRRPLAQLNSFPRSSSCDLKRAVHQRMRNLTIHSVRWPQSHAHVVIQRLVAVHGPKLMRWPCVSSVRRARCPLPRDPP